MCFYIILLNKFIILLVKTEMKEKPGTYTVMKNLIKLIFHFHMSSLKDWKRTQHTHP